MSSKTKNLDLLKMDPIADGNKTFNIETMLNENWDKIDEAVEEREKLLKENETKETPVDADSFVVIDSADSSKSKRLTWSKLKSTLKTYFDDLYLGAKGDGKDATVTFTAATTRGEVKSGDTLATLFGKIAKWLADLGSAAFKNTPTSGNASTTEVVLGSDTRLTDARTATAHTHNTADVTGGTLGVVRGGTGRATLTNGYFLRGNGLNPAMETAPSEVRGDIGAAARLYVEATLAIASWVGSAAPYTLALTISGITAADTPHIHCRAGTDASAAELIKEAWALIVGNPVGPQTSANTITFRATDKPTVAIPIMIEAVRT